MIYTNIRNVERKISQLSLGIFSSLDIQRAMRVSPIAARFLLHRYTKRGYITRVKRNFYTLSDARIPEAYIANRLVSPSYVSLESALSFHRVIRESVYAITSMTTAKSARVVVAHRQEYLYHHLRTDVFSGYTPVKHGAFTVLMAEPEKALADYYYLVLRGIRKPLDEERLRLDGLSRDAIVRYFGAFGDARMTRHLNRILSLMTPNL